MLKNILKLEATRSLSKTEQKSIEGGISIVSNHVLVCTANTNGSLCGPPHCTGRCANGPAGPYCLPF